MWECLRLGLRARRCGECSLGFPGGGSVGEEVDFLGNGPAKVIKGLADVGRVIVGFV